MINSRNRGDVSMNSDSTKPYLILWPSNLQIFDYFYRAIVIEVIVLNMVNLMAECFL